MSTPDKELTTEEAAEELGCSPRTVRYMIARGTISARMEKADPTAQKGVYKIKLSEIIRIQELLKQSS